RVRVLHQLPELGGEPRTGDRRVRQGTGRVVAVAGVAAVRRVAHPVEALALVVRDLRAGAVRLTRGLHPDVGVDTGRRVGPGPLTETGTGLVAPVAGVGPTVDPATVDVRVHAGGRARSGGPVGT